MRELQSLIDPDPLITPVLLRMGQWIASYYGCGIETVIRSLLPEAVRSEENSAKTRKIAVLDSTPDEEFLAKLGKRASRQFAILTLLARLGLRSCEVAALRLDDIDWGTARLSCCR